MSIGGRAMARASRARTRAVMPLRFRISLCAAALWCAGIAARRSAVASPHALTEGLRDATPPLADTSPARWNGWGPTVTNTRFLPVEAGGITVDDVPRLR